MESSRSHAVWEYRRHIVAMLLAAAHVAGILGLYVVLSVGRPRFMGFYLVAAASLLLFDLLLIADRYRDRIPDIGSYLSYAASSKVVVALTMVCVSLLLVDGQSPVFLLLVGGTVYLTVLVLGDAESTTESLLAVLLLCLQSALLMQSEVLKGVLFTGSTDTVRHLSNIAALASSGALENVPNQRFVAYPIVHVLSAEAVQITGGDVYDVSVVVMQICISLTVLFTFLTVRKVSNQQAAAIAAGILAVLPPIISLGSRIGYKGLSYGFLSLFVMLLVVVPTKRRNVLLLGVVFAWVFTHHVSLLLSLPFLALAIFVGGADVFEGKHRVYSLAVLGVLFFYYYLTSGEIGSILHWVFIASPVGADPGGYSIQYNLGFAELVTASLSDVLNYLYYVPIIAIPAAGFVTQVLSSDGGRLQRAHVVSILAVLPAFAIFVPSPLWILLEGTGQIVRWFPIVTPFMIIGVSIATWYYVAGDALTLRRSTVRSILAVSIVVLVLTAPNTGDLNGIAGYEGEPQRYITNAEMEAIDHVSDHPPTGTVHSYNTIRSFVETGAFGTDTVEPGLLQRYQVTSQAKLPPGISLISSETISENLVTVSNCLEGVTGQTCGFSTISVDGEQFGRDSAVVYTNGGASAYWRE